MADPSGSTADDMHEESKVPLENNSKTVLPPTVAQQQAQTQQEAQLQALLLHNPQLPTLALPSGPQPLLAQHEPQLLALPAHSQAPAQAQQQSALLLNNLTAPLSHNLIPSHLQASALAASLSGTPGHPAALIPQLQAQRGLAFPPTNTIITDPIATPVFTVQDRPMIPPVYNGVNPDYPGLRVINTSPPIFAVDNFLTPYECDFLMHVAQDSFQPAPVVGKGVGEISPSRTSSTCYLAREDLPAIMQKVQLLTGKPQEHCELPQVGRYFPSQQYLQHYDAFDLATEDGRRFAANGGQRTVTVLLYLNDVLRGGATRFPALNLEVQPRRGTALVFFPATVDGMLDKMALHAAMPAIDTKYVSQIWIRQSNYNGLPSKRLPQKLEPLPNQPSNFPQTNNGHILGAWEPAQPLQY